MEEFLDFVQKLMSHPHALQDRLILILANLHAHPVPQTHHVQDQPLHVIQAIQNLAQSATQHHAQLVNIEMAQLVQIALMGNISHLMVSLETHV
jgi:hypothetical protein